MTRVARLLLFMPSLLTAQNPPDTGGARNRPGRDAWVSRALSLSPDQTAMLAATRARFAPQRRAILERQRAIYQALRGQLQPGIAANGDSVRKLLDAREQNRGALAQLERDQEKEVAGYLSPVQRARLVLFRERFVGMRARRGHARRGRRGGLGGGGGRWRDGSD